MPDQATTPDHATAPDQAAANTTPDHAHRRAAGWWRRELAAESCPISLEPIRSFRRPPFELKADPALGHRTASDWFDAKILASYLVSRGDFTHPVSRRALGRGECESLDAHLLRHGLGRLAQVEHAFDHRDDSAATAAPLRLEQLRREAEGVLQALFSGADGPRIRRPDSRAPASSRSGNLTVIDDDQRPGQLAAAPPALADDADVEGSESGDADFPALPTPAPPRPPEAMPAVDERQRQQRQEQEAATRACEREAAARRARLASAFARAPDAPSSFDAAGGGARAAPAWEVRLEGVECARAVLAAMVAPALRGGGALEWPADGADGATLRFGSEAAAREALASLGGGRRGAFRVRAPQWASAPPPPPPPPPPPSPPRDAAPSHDWPVPPSPPAHEAAPAHEARAGGAPWRSRSVLARKAAAAAADAGGGAAPPAAPASAAGATPLSAGGHVLAAAPRAASKGARLGWDATRRLIWGAADDEDARERLREAGFSRGACARALRIAGEVDDATRSAAATEWLLLALRAIYCVDGVLPPPPHEPANPFAGKGGDTALQGRAADEEHEEEAEEEAEDGEDLPVPPWLAAAGVRAA